eukprot:TRINITY_DN2176_c0_g1_i1.p1 TRINITY_DN2176_c0_g1~~TRINITY_DN2176_c0_g1_i1.p1  ORF type:complete len:108 (-),score=3.26 TRINITY_DN2176_c0_g1_i1:20-343(-)
MFRSSICNNFISQVPHNHFKSRVLFQRMSHVKPNVTNDQASELKLHPLEDELSPLEREQLLEDLKSDVLYKLDKQAWIAAGKPRNRNPYMIVYRNGYPTSEKVPDYQ